VKQRVVFDTTTVLSALLFADGRLAWLRQHWREGGCVPLISRATAAELTRVFRYPVYGLSVDLLALAGRTGFGIETAEDYGRRVGSRGV